ncbi:MAG: 3-hydroxybutyryl-CoA dehydrogenase [Actinomycetia bacterium]|nr:3-hydroxybutyryl-CoA dehydrogenase [Actinomycetes bacterium]
MDMVTKLGVLGAGTMGGGIAHTAAQAGFEVYVYDTKEGQVDRALDGIRQRLDRAVAQGKESAEAAAATLARIHPVSDLAAFEQVEAAIEAVVEVMAVKKDAFAELDRRLPPGALLASNTSSFSITELAQSTRRRDRVVGMHFFNPAPVMKLVEVVRGEDTSDETVAEARELAHRMGKETVVVQKDTPGFIVNRVLIPLFIEAIRILEEGIASAEDIDKAVKLGLNHPMGPLTLADLTGLDVDLNVMDYLFQETHDPRFAAPLTLRRLVRAGRLGRKTGRGFYTY